MSYLFKTVFLCFLAAILFFGCKGSGESGNSGGRDGSSESEDSLVEDDHISPDSGDEDKGVADDDVADNGDNYDDIADDDDIIPPLECPEEMVAVPFQNAPVCIDKYEVSRSVSTAESEVGECLHLEDEEFYKCIYESYPTVRAGVIAMWGGGHICKRLGYSNDLLCAQELDKENKCLFSNAGVGDWEGICAMMGKRLCKSMEWENACRGEGYTLYPYGDEFIEGKCIYPWEGIEYKCAGCMGGGHGGACPHLTGSAPECRSASGAYDMVGGMPEWIIGERPDSFGFYEKLAGGHPYPAYLATIDRAKVPDGWTGDPSRPGCDARMNLRIWFGTRTQQFDGGVRCCADMEYINGKWQMAPQSDE